MKTFILFLSITVLFCAFTACDDDSTDPSTENCSNTQDDDGDGLIDCDDPDCQSWIGCQSNNTPENCGNDQLDADEECEGTNLGGESCGSLGYYGGELSCASDCRFNTTVCEIYGSCGDGVVQEDQGETCDGMATTLTCDDLGAGSGTIGCDDGCQVDTSQCSDQCAAAGNACSASELCCETTGWSCIDTSEDLEHCGDCNNACDPVTANSCMFGMCSCGTTAECTSGRACCGHSCKDLQTDIYNCGTCGNACGAGLSCINGLCMCGTVQCSFGETCCGTYCADLDADPANCGSCEHDCGSGGVCNSGTCS